MTIATGYIPPRQPYINTIDLNAYHRTFGYNTNNLRGQQIVTLIDTDKCRHIGPFFDTRVTANTRRKPDIALTNNRAYLNTYLRPGPMTPSDHIPIVMTISTNPIQIPICPRLQFSKTDWTRYKQILTDFNTPDMNQETLEN